MKSIQTKRLTLRALNADDIDDLYEIYRNTETCRYTLDEPWTDNTKTDKFNKKFINQSLDDNQALNMAVMLGNKVIGEVLAWYAGRQTIEIGYVFNAHFGGKGYAFEAVSAMVNYLFDNHDIHRLYANMDARNFASKKICEKLNMRQEAHFIQDFWNKGEWTDSLIFGLLRDEYHNKQTLY